MAAVPSGFVSVLSHAVMTLRHFEREAEKKQDEMRETPHSHTKRELQNKQLKEKDKNLLLVRLFEQK